MDKRKIAFLLIPVFWISAIWGIVVANEYHLAHGREVILKPIPVDPRDMFRGDYVTLRYDISTLEYYDYNYNNIQTPRINGMVAPGSYDYNMAPAVDSTGVKAGDTIYVLLDPDGTLQSKYGNQPFVTVKPESLGQLYIKGIVKDAYRYSDNTRRLIKAPNGNTRITVEYGIESYFIPEGTGGDIQKKLRNGTLDAHVVIDRNGNAILKSLE